MLDLKEIEEIKEHLDRAQNPIFLFDNDTDGLCSFLLLQRYLGRGKGVCIKSFPDLGPDYFRKVNELSSDYIFILDKPLVSKEFWQEVEKVNIPVVWIDHHENERDKIPEYVHYYNPLFSESKSSEPVTALCYDIVKRVDDVWLAVMGCVADCYFPPFYPEFVKKYPDLAGKAKIAFDVLYRTEIGRLAKIINNGMKDKTTKVILMLKFLMKVKNPYEVFEESKENYAMHKRSKEIDEKYNLLFEKAKSHANDSKFLFFKYAGNLSISGELSNELGYNYPDKYVFVAYIRGTKVNLSMRGKNVLEKFNQIIGDIKEGRGGGHPDAIGGQMHVDDLEKFVEKFRKIV